MKEDNMGNIRRETNRTYMTRMKENIGKKINERGTNRTKILGTCTEAHIYLRNVTNFEVTW
jgi:hypothetical protein